MHFKHFFSHFYLYFFVLISVGSVLTSQIYNDTRFKNDFLPFLVVLQQMQFFIAWRNIGKSGCVGDTKSVNFLMFLYDALSFDKDRLWFLEN